MRISLEVDKQFFPHFKAIIDSLAHDNKVSILHTDTYDYAAQAPQSAIISSKKEVQTRVIRSEERITHGEYLTQSEYDTHINDFFGEELGIKR